MTNQFIQAIAQRDLEAAKQATEDAQKATDSVDKAAEAQRDLVTAKAALKAIQDQWSNGDSSPTAAAYTKAVAEVEKASAIHAGHVRRSNYRAPFLEPLLAQRIGAVLEGYLEGAVPVVATVKAVNDRPAEEDTPVLVLVQTKDEQHDKFTGIASGNVAVAYHKSRLLAPLDHEELSTALREAGFDARITANAAPQADRQNLSISIRQADPSTLPLIDLPGGSEAFKAHLRKSGQPGALYALQSSLDGRYRYVGATTLDRPVSVSEQDGIRRTKATVDYALQELSFSNGEYRPVLISKMSDSDAQALRGFDADGLIGSLIPGAGVITAATKQDVVIQEGAAILSVALEVSCKVPDSEIGGDEFDEDEWTAKLTDAEREQIGLDV